MRNHTNFSVPDMHFFEIVMLIKVNVTIPILVSDVHVIELVMLIKVNVTIPSLVCQVCTLLN